MTFSSVSRSSLEVEEVAATAAGVTGLRAGVGAVTRWRAGGAGAATGADSEGVAISRAAAVAGCTLRATGRGFGSGILCLAGGLAASAEHPNAIVKPTEKAVANAVDRNAFAWTIGVTAYLRGRIKEIAFG